MPGIDKSDWNNLGCREGLNRIVKDRRPIFNVTFPASLVDFKFSVGPIEFKTPLGSKAFVTQNEVRPPFLGLVYAIVFLLKETIVSSLIIRTTHASVQRFECKRLNIAPFVFRYCFPYFLENDFRSLVVCVEIRITNIGQCNWVVTQM